MASPGERSRPGAVGGSPRCWPPAPAAWAPTSASLLPAAARGRRRPSGLRRRPPPTSSSASPPPARPSARSGSPRAWPRSPTPARSSRCAGPRAGADLVHAHGLRAGLVAAAARRPAGPGAGPAGAHPAQRAARRRRAAAAGAAPGSRRATVRGADLVLAASGDLADNARRLGARDVRVAPVVGAAAAAGEPRPGPRCAPSSASPTAARWWWRWAGCTRRRATHVLLDAVGRLGGAGRRAAGRDRRRRSAAGASSPPGSRAERLPVRLLGRRTDVADLLGAADVCVLPSRLGGPVAHRPGGAARRAPRWSPPAPAASPSWWATPPSWCRSGTPRRWPTPSTGVLADPAARRRLAEAGRRAGRAPGPTRPAPPGRWSPSTASCSGPAGEAAERRRRPALVCRPRPGRRPGRSRAAGRRRRPAPDGRPTGSLVVGVPGLTWSDVDPDAHPGAVGSWPGSPRSARCRCAPPARPPACSTAGRPWAPATAPAVPGPDEAACRRCRCRGTATGGRAGDGDRPAGAVRPRRREDTSLSYCGLQEQVAAVGLADPQAAVALIAADEATARFGAEPAALGDARRLRHRRRPGRDAWPRPGPGAALDPARRAADRPGRDRRPARGLPADPGVAGPADRRRHPGRRRRPTTAPTRCPGRPRCRRSTTALAGCAPPSTTLPGRHPAAGRRGLRGQRRPAPAARGDGRRARASTGGLADARRAPGGRRSCS